MLDREMGRCSRHNRRRCPALLAIALFWLFGGIAEDVVAGDPLTILDKNIAEWFHEHPTPVLMATMQFVTDLASTIWVTGVGTACALVLWWKQCWYRLWPWDSFCPVAWL